MTEPTDAPVPGDLPEPRVERRKRWHVPLIWLVPLVAAIIGLSLVVHAYLSEGPSIRIQFATAEGIEPGKTPVKFKNVVIGKVRAVTLDPDRNGVEVRVGLDKRYAYFASSGSRFWVVRPRIGLGGISGLGTLFSGTYIGADTGGPGAQEERYRFKGRETPPPLTHGEVGSSYLVSSPDLGSLDIGSPVYFRRIQVGRVVGYTLDKNGRGVRLQVFVNAPYDRYVRRNTRFWNASGVSVALDAGGVRIHSQSLASVVSGGMAFLAPPGEAPGARAPGGTQFRLFASRSKAMQPPDGPPVVLHMRFSQSVRGLSVGAPVDFEGIAIGEVKHIGVTYDAQHHRFPIDVTAVVYPQRLGAAHEEFARRMGKAYLANPGLGLALLVRNGLRAQLRSGNLLTGQLYITMDFFPDAPRVRIDPDQTPLWLPTVPGSFDQLQEQLTRIAGRLDKVPFDRIAHHLDRTLVDLDATLRQVHDSLGPETGRTLRQARSTLQGVQEALASDSPLQQNLGQTLEQVRRAARSLRVLTDYLERHPEALLLGKPDHEPALPEPVRKKEKQP